MENNTKQSFSIGEIAELLNISTSKLRFWEKKGLFSITKSDNHYRTYSYLDLIPDDHTSVGGRTNYQSKKIRVDDSFTSNLPLVVDLLKRRFHFRQSLRLIF